MTENSKTTSKTDGYCFPRILLTKNEYQTSYPVTAVASTMKLRGVLDTRNIRVTDLHPVFRKDSHIYLRIWDSLDLIPSRGDTSKNGLIVITNVAVTADQTLSDGVCPEDVDSKLFLCTSNKDCPKGEQKLKGHGIMTGKCVNSDIEKDKRTCEISGWCPVARSTRPLLNSGKALLSDAHILTVFLKSTAEIAALDVSLNNIKQVQNMKNGPNFETCIFNQTSETDRHCPRFRLHDIVKYATQDGSDRFDFNEVALSGGVFMLKVEYDCDLDIIPLENCLPSTVVLYDGIRIVVHVEGQVRKITFDAVYDELALFFSWCSTVFGIMGFFVGCLLLPYLKRDIATTSNCKGWFCTNFTCERFECCPNPNVGSKNSPGHQLTVWNEGREYDLVNKKTNTL
ncbi:P2X purinoceptor 6 [Folsomia candida]|uniref:P2X purinoceptor 6 n=1 Tax=Folsomia candida TaxID=158441 RepID=A0A226DJH8_FOLCA|nr:P2X purinoceptor 6 [Folsomia candida]